MKFSAPLQQGTFLRRYKRFLVDVGLPGGEEITIHCPNTGSMRACLAEGSPCWFSRSDNPARKYPHTWEIATTPAGDLAGVNTGRANGLVVEAIEAGVITELQGYNELATEVRYGEERSRIDILLSGAGGDCYVEVKSVTLCEDGDRGLFPDAVSSRGAKHLRELMLMVARGHRAVLCYCVQHSAITSVAAAEHIDPAYSTALREAVAAGVEVLAYGARLGPTEIVLDRALPFIQ
ncbi:MAG: DNA/RNA nuclease SfsA [Gammaproteobacteria bacterium]|uniref:DNA/RNA nuclease SfsA n=1 Tax=Pseudomaricurvus alcaniphilus TaxID=1166482 RepID=UPI00140903EE|nr:DNA/RNA nuclease SfsA [Pseudomaricurvus alcaniphilus]MBR9909533.1 DNA/RNA nuclease SfsA [Gammaproteobacteria bacterium]NHN37052.1 DNA/RNA nuclease SfsA [Pseudomaricurvus alcaniphilus]